MPLRAKEELDSFADAIQTKNTLVMIEQRHEHEKGVGVASESRGTRSQTSGLQVPAYDQSGNLFGAGTIGRTGYGLMLPQDFVEQTLIDLLGESAAHVYGQVEKVTHKGVEIRKISKQEFDEIRKKDPKIEVVKVDKGDLAKIKKGGWKKIIERVIGFFFLVSEDTVDSFFAMLIKLLVLIGIVMTGTGLAAYFWLQ